MSLPAKSRPRDELHADRPKEAWRNGVEVDLGAARARRHRRAVKRDALRPRAILVADRRIERQARRLHARQVSESFQQLIEEHRQPFVLVARGLGIGGNDEDIVAIESRVLRQDAIEAAHEQRRAEEQQHRQRDLRGYE